MNASAPERLVHTAPPTLLLVSVLFLPAPVPACVAACVAAGLTFPVPKQAHNAHASDMQATCVCIHALDCWPACMPTQECPADPCNGGLQPPHTRGSLAHPAPPAPAATVATMAVLALPATLSALVASALPVSVPVFVSVPVTRALLLPIRMHRRSHACGHACARNDVADLVTDSLGLGVAMLRV